MPKVDPHLMLAALWLFILLNNIFRVLHQFVIPGFIETIMTGHFNGMEITPELMLFVGVVITTATTIRSAPMDLDDTYHLVLQLVWFCNSSGSAALGCRWHCRDLLALVARVRR